jgi:hypothetical protein
MIGAAPAPASTQSACANSVPCNDNYISSLELNRPGTKLDRVHTLRDQRNLSTATVQGDIFNPPATGGPAEDTNCNGTGYGNTVWYDVHPDATGTVNIRTAAFFENAITLYSYSMDKTSQSYLVPHKLGCTESSLGSGQLVASVTKGTAYTIQIGAVAGGQAPGPIRLLFDYFVTPPRRLSAQTTLKARAQSTGIQLIDLTVATARGTRINISCSGFCSSQTKSVPKFGTAMQDFSRLNGVRMPSGSKLLIRVTAPHSIGTVIQYNILPGNFSKQTFCTEPGSQKLRTKCH